MDMNTVHDKRKIPAEHSYAWQRKEKYETSKIKRKLY